MRYLLGILFAIIFLSTALAQETKIAATGFEVNSFNNGTVSVAYTTKRALTITGYQFFISMAPSPGANLPSMWGTAQLAEVLFYVTMDSIPAVNDFTVGITKDFQNGKNGLHGGNAALGNGQIAQAILKTLVSQSSQSSVNTPLVATNLHIPLPAGATITLWAGHGGWGPMDFEFQGNFTYE